MREASTVNTQGEGKLCSLTNRIMVVSPMPERIRDLLTALTAECFDLFTLHDYSQDVLQGLKPELLICDALPVPQRPELSLEWVGQAFGAGAAVILLVDGGEGKAPQISRAWRERGVETISWPSSPKDALRRIREVLSERASASSPVSIPADKLTFKDITVNLRKMTVEKGGARLDLTKTEYDLLLHFLRSDGAVQTRESLLDDVWGQQFYAGSNVVDVHIKSLRKKLQDSAVISKYIVTVRGAGYRLADQPGNA